MNEDPGIEPVAIIGMAGRFPGAGSIAEFWRNLRDGVESISTFSAEELIEAGEFPHIVHSPNYVPAKGVVDDIETFDAGFFGMNAREAEITDPQHRLFLECSWLALEDAGYTPEGCPKSTAVFAGGGLPRYLINLFENEQAIASQGLYQTIIGNDKDFIATRVAYKLNLSGPAIGVQTACSTSLVAVHLAWQSLIGYQCDMALAGGVSLDVPQKCGYLYQEGGIESPDGHCRVFDAQARGTVGGNGVGVVVLRRLSEALQHGDRIVAVIRGSAINNDGARKVGFTAPSVEGQARVVAEALAVAGVAPETVGYIEAHGTGTELGDPIEVAALREVFRRPGPGRGAWCGLGSVKSNIGHLDAAAGVAGLIKAALAVEQGEIPASLHYQRANPKLELEGSAFYVNAKLRKWESAGPRRAGVSSFGIGGTNAHLILEQAPERASQPANRRTQLLMLSGRSAGVVAQQRRELGRQLQNWEGELADVAYTLQSGRRAQEWRYAVVSDNAAQAAEKLLAGAGEAVLARAGRKVAFVFPGQGAQEAGMGAALYAEEAVFGQELDRCAQLLEGHWDVDVRELLCAQGAGWEEKLEQTEYTQPALFVMEYALARQWMSWGVTPEAMLGHSLGEYVAACLAGVMSLQEALRAVVERGRLIQSMEPGAMLAVGLEEAAARGHLQAGELWLSAVNGPGLSVIGGRAEAVERLRQRLEREGVLARRLRTSHAFHTGLLDGAVEEFQSWMRGVKLQRPTLRYLSNLTGGWMDGEAVDPGYWARHLRGTVQFGAGLKKLCEPAERLVLEIGPGRTLTTLARAQFGEQGGSRVLPSLPAGKTARDLLETAGRLWELGVELDWKAIHAGRRRLRVSLPTYPFERQRYWIERQPPAESDTSRIADVRNWLYVPGWRRSAEIQAENTQTPAVTLLFVAEPAPALDNALGNQVVKVMPGTGFARSAGSYSIDPFSDEQFRLLLRKVGDTHGCVTHVVWLWSLFNGLESHPGATGSRALAPEFYSLACLVRALADVPGGGSLELTVVTSGAFAVTGDEPLDPRKTALLGIGRVLSQEYATIRCRHIDIDSDRPAGWDAMAREITGTTADRVVALRGRTRWVQTVDPAPISYQPCARRIKNRGVYLITGGSGRIGLLLADWLARKAKARIALVGRTVFPERSQRLGELGRKLEAIQQIEQHGAEVLLLSADAGRPEELERAWNEAVQRFGRIDGVIHAAGQVGAASMCAIPELTDDRIEAQFHAKVGGALSIERAATSTSLDFCIAFSSIASCLGGLGFAAYAGANLYLDGLAQRKPERPRLVFESIGWDGWEFDDEDIGTAIGPADADAVFDVIFDRPLAQHVVVSPRPVEPRIRLWCDQPAPQSAKSPKVTTHHPRPPISSPFVAPASNAERVLAGFWTELLGIGDVGIEDNFFDLGGHSLLLMQLASRLRQEFGVSVPLRSLFEGPTIREMLQALEQELERQLPEDIRGLLEQVQQMSLEEVEQQLVQRADSIN